METHEFLPYPSNYMEVAGHQMHYLDVGEGPVVFLFHGNPTWCFYYRSLIQKLSGSFRVIAPDFLGCGLSDRPTKTFRALDRVEHLEEFVKKLGVEQFSLVMHDWGGPIGTNFAVRHIEKLQKLVYLNTTLTETESLPAIIKNAASPLIGKFLTQTTRHFLKLTTGVGVHRKLPREIKKGYFFPYRTRAQRKAIWDFVADIPFDSNHPSYVSMLDLAEALPKLSSIPVQIIWGLKDPCFHRGMLDRVAEHFPHARILEIPEASHLVLEDAPELCENTIKDFLQTDTTILMEENKKRREEEFSRYESGNALYHAFSEIARTNPFQNAAVAPLFFTPDEVRYQYSNYRELQSLIYKYQRGLIELGLRKEDKVLFLVSPGVEFLALSYAVMACGAIPVYLDPGMGKENLFRCIEDLQPDAFIGSPKAHILRILKRKLFKNLKFHLAASEWIFTGGPTLKFLKRFSLRPIKPVESSDTAMIAFTSGGTGVPKGVVFTDSMIREQLRIFRDEFGLQNGKRDLPLLPIFSLFTVSLGICSVFPPVNPSKPLSLSPAKIVKLVNDLQIDYSFGSPTLWNKIMEYCIRCRIQLHSMQKIFMAGAPVSQEVLGKVQGILRNGTAYTPYGSTEALPVTLVSGDEIEQFGKLSALSGEQGTFVGKPVSGVDVRIVESRQSAISSMSETRNCEPLEIGEVLVRGANVSPLYLERPEATAQAKIQDQDSFWHRMGDMGYLDTEGNLYFCGRQAHAVPTHERIYYSVPVETIFNQHQKVKRTALIPVEKGPGVGIVVEPHPQYWPESEEKQKEFSEELQKIAQGTPLTQAIEKIYFHPSFPVDGRHNAKIFRDKLGIWAAEKESKK